MATTPKKTDEVLASARKDLQAQLAVVRDEMGRLAGEERALTQALSSLDGDGSSSRSAATRAAKVAGGPPPGKSSTRRSSAGNPGASRRRRRRGGTKSTADRLSELEGLLSDGPKSRNDLAAALKLSPARVQQLLSELGGKVSSQPAPQQRQGKLWTLAGRGNGASAAKPTRRRSSGKAKSTTRKPAARSKQAK